VLVLTSSTHVGATRSRRTIDDAVQLANGMTTDGVDTTNTATNEKSRCVAA
jgi:hypothetical protein